jgi:hypothetical protein
MSALDDYFKRKGLTYTHRDGIINVPDNPFGMDQLGLVNLAQNCKLQDNENSWPEMITDHFETMIKANAFDKEFNTRKRDFSYVKEFIGVRLYHKSYFNALGLEKVLYKLFADVIVTVLIFDTPHTVTSIKPEDAALWNVPIDELFSIGTENMRQRYPPGISKENVGEVSIWFCQSNDLFATNLALDREAMEKYSGSKGALVGIPHRHALLIYPIESLEVVKAINTLIPVISGMNNEGPGSISEKLFWYRDGKYIDLPYEIGDKKLSFRPPDEFVEMIQSLA